MFLEEELGVQIQTPYSIILHKNIYFTFEEEDKLDASQAFNAFNAFTKENNKYFGLQHTFLNFEATHKLDPSLAFNHFTKLNNKEVATLILRI